MEFLPDREWNFLLLCYFFRLSFWPWRYWGGSMGTSSFLLHVVTLLLWERQLSHSASAFGLCQRGTHGGVLDRLQRRET